MDVGPHAGEGGGSVLYSGPVQGLADVPGSVTRPFLLDGSLPQGPVPQDSVTQESVPQESVPQETAGPAIVAQSLSETSVRNKEREPLGTLHLGGVTRHNLHNLDAEFPLGVLTVVTGVSGSGKSTLVSQVLADVVGSHVRNDSPQAEASPSGPETAPEAEAYATTHIDSSTAGTADAAADIEVAPGDRMTVQQITGLESIDRLVRVDQKPIGRTPRSNLATYTGLFDAVRKLYAGTDAARSRGFNAGRFSFNVAAGRCETCQGEGFVAVELLFLPGSYGPCPTCHGSRYNSETLEVTYRGRNIAEVLGLTVDAAAQFLSDVPAAARSLETLREVGLGYLRLGQPATELSGGEAQRIKLATELQRSRRGHTLYLLDEPTTGLHPADVQLLMKQLNRLVDAGNTVVLVEHDMDVAAAADWVIDLGPSGGDAGGHIMAAGPPRTVAAKEDSVTAPYLAKRLTRSVEGAV